jgi:hypothetical protein
VNDRELTTLQEAGAVYMVGPVPLGEVLDGLETLGIDPGKVVLGPGGVQVVIGVAR